MGWNDVVQGSSGGSDKKVNFLTLKKGNYLLRALDSEPTSRWTHWIPPNGNHKGATVSCLGKDCPVCALVKEMKAKGTKTAYNTSNKHAMNFINRKTGEVVVIDKGFTFWDALGNIMSVAGDLTDYDFTLVVGGTDDKPSYTPIPSPKIPLSEADKALEKYDLSDITKPHPIDKILGLMQGKSWEDMRNENADTNTNLVVDFTK